MQWQELAREKLNEQLRRRSGVVRYGGQGESTAPKTSTTGAADRKIETTRGQEANEAPFWTDGHLSDSPLRNIDARSAERPGGKDLVSVSRSPWPCMHATVPRALNEEERWKRRPRRRRGCWESKRAEGEIADISTSMPPISTGKPRTPHRNAHLVRVPHLWLHHCDDHVP